ncbi:MAG: tyrosine-type recombinase/integrase [Candidatus Sericytochromatia bacterium]
MDLILSDNTLEKVNNNNSLEGMVFINDKNYDCHIKQFNNYLKDNNLPLTRENLAIFWQWLLKQDYSPQTLNVKKQALKLGIKKTLPKESDSYMFISMLNEFFKEELKGFKIDKAIYEGDTLNKEEIDILIEKTPKKISLIIETLAISGLRVSELLSLRLKNSKLSQGFHYFKVVGKGRKERTIYLTDELLKRIKNAYKSKDYLFINKNGEPFSRRYVHAEIHKYGQEILLKDVHPHTLRHSFATIKHQEGKSIKGISKYLGHASTSITLDMYVDTPLKPSDVFD